MTVSSAEDEDDSHTVCPHGESCHAAVGPPHHIFLGPSLTGLPDEEGDGVVEDPLLDGESQEDGLSHASFDHPDDEEEDLDSSFSPITIIVSSSFDDDDDDPLSLLLLPPLDDFHVLFVLDEGPHPASLLLLLLLLEILRCLSDRCFLPCPPLFLPLYLDILTVVLSSMRSALLVAAVAGGSHGLDAALHDVARR